MVNSGCQWQIMVANVENSHKATEPWLLREPAWGHVRGLGQISAGHQLHIDCFQRRPPSVSGTAAVQPLPQPLRVEGVLLAIS